MSNSILEEHQKISCLLSKFLCVTQEEWPNIRSFAIECLQSLLREVWDERWRLRKSETFTVPDDLAENCVQLMARCFQQHVDLLSPELFMQFVACMLPSKAEQTWAVCQLVPVDQAFESSLQQCFHEPSWLESPSSCCLLCNWSIIHAFSKESLYPSVFDLLTTISSLSSKQTQGDASSALAECKYWLAQIVENSLLTAEEDSFVFYVEMILESVEFHDCVSMLLENEQLLQRIRRISNPEVKLNIDFFIKKFRQQQSAKAPTQSTKSVSLEEPSNAYQVDDGLVQELLELFPQLSLADARHHLLAANNRLDLATEYVLSGAPGPAEASSSAATSTVPAKPVKLGKHVTSTIASKPTTVSGSGPRTIFDNDEIDRLEISPDRVYMNKKPEEPDVWKRPMRHLDKEKVLKLVELSYEDEYDDTYDAVEAMTPHDPGVGDDDAEAAAQEVREQLQYTNSILYNAYEQNPSLFDPKARKTQERADLLAQLGKGFTHEQVEGWRRMYTRDPKFAAEVRQTVVFGSGNANTSSNVKRTHFRQSEHTDNDDEEKSNGHGQHRPSRPRKNPALAKKKYQRSKPNSKPSSKPKGKPGAKASGKNDK
ncbi:CUE domain-containing protein Cue3 [Schizosaccharomyces japonicus yFS275]|uniref:CUE domain-containing protein Cue3 n=1 Tax=Schizosaccharomyces japonicus (strain yFS275 / FY16936) TaxID=402676 RepID=B6K3K1_SCHJY|nr:CUE domain-containing protein Cue3 [Schizosaccharomyces japonicus yFS275]EEB08058.1 CUE domain-containing protein Cue3 [Schizosaccharomyces japonicus yFS275]